MEPSLRRTAARRPPSDAPTLGRASLQGSWRRWAPTWQTSHRTRAPSSLGLAAGLARCLRQVRPRA
eukprot:5180873-Lingulodinium_polyedra.AAC.1